MTHSYKANIILALAAAVVLIALRILDAPAPVAPAPVAEVAQPLTGVSPEVAPLDQPAVLYAWEDVRSALVRDVPVLINAPRLDRSVNWVDDEELLWFVPRFGAPIVSYDTFACYRLYEYESGDEVQCGPMHSEDQYDGVAVFYMREADLARLFAEYITYAVAIADPPEFE